MESTLATAAACTPFTMRQPSARENSPPSSWNDTYASYNCANSARVEDAAATILNVSCNGLDTSNRFLLEPNQTSEQLYFFKNEPLQSVHLNAVNASSRYILSSDGQTAEEYESDATEMDEKIVAKSFQVQGSLVVPRKQRLRMQVSNYSPIFKLNSSSSSSSPPSSDSEQCLTLPASSDPPCLQLSDLDLVSDTGLMPSVLSIDSHNELPDLQDYYDGSVFDGNSSCMEAVFFSFCRECMKAQQHVDLLTQATRASMQRKRPRTLELRVRCRSSSNDNKVGFEPELQQRRQSTVAKVRGRLQSDTYEISHTKNMDQIMCRTSRQCCGIGSGIPFFTSLTPISLSRIVGPSDTLSPQRHYYMRGTYKPEYNSLSFMEMVEITTTVVGDLISSVGTLAAQTAIAAAAALLDGNSSGSECEEEGVSDSDMEEQDWKDCEYFVLNQTATPFHFVLWAAGKSCSFLDKPLDSSFSVSARTLKSNSSSTRKKSLQKKDTQDEQGREEKRACWLRSIALHLLLRISRDSESWCSTAVDILQGTGQSCRKIHLRAHIYDGNHHVKIEGGAQGDEAELGAFRKYDERNNIIQKGVGGPVSDDEVDRMWISWINKKDYCVSTVRKSSSLIQTLRCDEIVNKSTNKMTNSDCPERVALAKRTHVERAIGHAGEELMWRAIRRVLKVDLCLMHLLSKSVPQHMDEEVFWKKYFYQVYLVMEKYQRQAHSHLDVMNRAFAEGI